MKIFHQPHRCIAGDSPLSLDNRRDSILHDAWLKAAFAEMYRVLRTDCFAVNFYGWSKADRFLTAFRAAGFRVVGHFVFPKRYTSQTQHALPARSRLSGGLDCAGQLVQ
jgi:DNA modification methylase